MANSNLKFSLVMEAVTAAFNSAVKQSGTTFSDVSQGINKEAAAIAVNSGKVSTSLKDALQAGDSRAVTSALSDTTKELNNMAQGAVLSANQLKQVGSVGKSALGELKAELVTARAELSALSTTKAAPAELLTARDRVASLTREIGNTQSGFQRFQAAAVAAMQRAAASTDDVEAHAKAAGAALYEALNIRSSGAIRTELAAITRDLEKFKVNSGAPAAEVDRVTQAAQARITQLRTEMSGLGPAAQSSTAGIAGLGRELLGVAGVTVGLAGVASGLKEIVDVALKFERINKQFQAVTGDVKLAGEAFEFARTTARSMGLDVQASAGGYAKLMAATKGSRLEGQDTKDVFVGISSAAAAMGLSVEDTGGIFLAVGQMAGKGRIQMEELRGQLGERFPPALRIMADSLGVTTQRLEEMVNAGLDADVVLGSFGRRLQTVYSGEAAKNLDSLQGRITNLKSEFESLLNYLAQSGVTSGVSKVFGELATIIHNIQDELKHVDPAAMRAVVETLLQLYNAGKETFKVLFEAISDVNKLINEVVISVNTLVGAFTGMGSKADQEVGLVTRAFQGVSILLGLVSDGIYAIRIGFTALTGAVQDWGSATALAISKITFGKLSEGLAQVSKDLQQSSKESFASAQKLAENFQGSAKAAIDRAVENNEAGAKKTGEAFVAAAGTVAGAQTQIAGALAGTATASTATAQAVVTGFKFIGAEALATTVRMNALGDGGASALGSIGKAAEQAKVFLQVFAGSGGEATIEVGKAADGTKDAFKGLAATLGITLPPGVKNITDMGLALGAVVVTNERVAAQFGKDLPAQLASLNAVDLAAFRESVVNGLKQAGANADVLKTAVLELDGAIAKTLGADLGGAQNTLTQAFKDSTKSLEGLIARFPDLKKAGVDTGILVRDSLEGMLAKAKNPAELEYLIKKFKEMGNAGELSARQVGEGISAARNKIDDLKPGINSVAEAFRTFGFATRDDIKLVAAKYLEAFNLMKSSGTATAEELRQAWQKYTDAALAGQKGLAQTAAQAFAQLGLKTKEQLDATAAETQQAFILIQNSGQATKAILAQAFTQYAIAAVAANNGVVSSYLQARAAALGLKIEVDAAGQTQVAALTEFQQKIDNVNLSYQDLQKAESEAGKVGVQAANDTAAALDNQAAAANRAASASAAAGKAVAAAASGGGGRKGAFDSDVDGIASGRGGASGGGFLGFPEPAELYASVKAAGGSDGLARRMQNQGDRFYSEVYLGEGYVKFFSWDKFEKFVANEVNRERQSVAQGGPEDPGGQGVSSGPRKGLGAGSGPKSSPGYDPNRPGQRAPGSSTSSGSSSGTGSFPIDPPGSRIGRGGSFSTDIPAATGRTVKLQLVSGGRTIDATVDEADEADLLRILKRAKGLA